MPTFAIDVADTPRFASIFAMPLSLFSPFFFRLLAADADATICCCFAPALLMLLCCHAAEITPLRCRHAATFIAHAAMLADSRRRHARDAAFADARFDAFDAVGIRRAVVVEHTVFPSRRLR